MQSVASENDTYSSDCKMQTDQGIRNSLQELFDSLPVEVVSMVFTHSVHPTSTINRTSSSPLILGKICRRWRQIAWSTPALWTYLRMYPRQATSETHVDLAQEWLARSGTLPLSIHYAARYDGYQYFEHELLPIGVRMLEVLSAYSDRWFDLTLDLPSSLLASYRLRSTPCTAPLLHNLSLTGTQDDDDERQRQLVSVLSNCSPRIVKTSYLQVELDWKFVTDLTMSLVDVAEIPHIFRSATSLVGCTLEQVWYYGTEPSTVQHAPAVCPLLETLLIEFADERSQVDFCRTVSLPGLKHLAIRSGFGVIEFATWPLLTFLTQSSCDLRSLVIDESEHEPDCLIRLAPFLSSLAELHLYFNSSFPYQLMHMDSNTFHHVLANQSPANPLHGTSPCSELLLPSLQIFSWDGRAPYPWETIPGLLRPVCQNGVSHPRPLKSVKIRCVQAHAGSCPYISTETIQRLMDFEDVRFDFTVDSLSDGQQGVDWWKASLESSEGGLTA